MIFKGTYGIIWSNCLHSVVTTFARPLNISRNDSSSAFRSNVSAVPKVCFEQEL